MRKSTKLGSSTGCRHYNRLTARGFCPWRQLNLWVLEILLHCMWKGEHHDWMSTWIHVNLTAFKYQDFFSDILLYAKTVKLFPPLPRVTHIHAQSRLSVHRQDLQCPTCHHLPGAQIDALLQSHHGNWGQTLCCLDLGNSLCYLWIGRQTLQSHYRTQNIPLS